TFGGSNSERPGSIATDGVNVYVTGTFASDTVNIGGTTLVNAGLTDIFVVKLNGDGSYVWAEQIGAGAWDFGHAITVSATRTGFDLYLTGEYGEDIGHGGRTVDFDPSPVGTFTLTSTGERDAFILKLNTDGGFVWARDLGGSGMAFAAGLALTAD